MTIKEYLEGLFEDDLFTDKNYNSIFIKYNVDSDDDLANVGEREKDLCYAELLLLLSNKANGSGSSVKHSESIRRGNFDKSESNESAERNYSFTWLDRRDLRQRAYALFRKWGVEVDGEKSEYHYQIGGGLWN